MTKITVYFHTGPEASFEANGYDVLSCGLLAIRVEVAALKNSLIASVSKERVVNIPLTSIHHFEVEA
jgi:hypothetical protein